MGLADQAVRILAEPVTAGVLVEPRGTQPAYAGGLPEGPAGLNGTSGSARDVGGGPMFLAATDAELVLLAVGRGLLARRLSGVVLARVARPLVQAIDLEERGGRSRSRGAVDLTVRMIDGDTWPLSVAAGQHATAAEVASLIA